MHALPVARSEYAEAQDDDVAFVADDRRWREDGRLMALESRLAPRARLRAYRSYIRGQDAIARVEPGVKDGRCAVREPGARVPIIREGRTNVCDLMR